LVSKTSFSLTRLRAHDQYAEWLTSSADGAPTSSNLHSGALAFQRWYNFKEAFSPAFVLHVVESLGFRPTNCVDPFCGSGTTALTCQFLGLPAKTIEVNPFVADVAEAKLVSYSPHSLIAARASLVKRLRHTGVTVDDPFPAAPTTFVQPGVEGRWIYSRQVADRIVAYRSCIERLPDEVERRLFRVLLGSILIPLSNVVISGKGRRYRSESTRDQTTPADVDRLFEDAFQKALFDITRFGRRACMEYQLLRGDARERLAECSETDLVLFSPPYPNSFDYTDIYNVELWSLGYLNSSESNRMLRNQTLRSHVQIRRDFAANVPSDSLRQTIGRLRRRRSMIWNQNIPEMIGAYFDDMRDILGHSKSILSRRGRIVIVVGDSQYVGVSIDVAKIIIEIGDSLGLSLIRRERLRHMRSSAQQGGRMALTEWRLDFSR
jgi:hypothetical protein